MNDTIGATASQMLNLEAFIGSVAPYGHIGCPPEASRARNGATLMDHGKIRLVLRGIVRAKARCRVPSVVKVVLTIRSMLR